jgi:hypothetical protein
MRFVPESLLRHRRNAPAPSVRVCQRSPERRPRWTLSIWGRAPAHRSLYAQLDFMCFASRGCCVSPLQPRVSPTEISATSFTFNRQCVTVISVTGHAAKRMNRSIFETRAPRAFQRSVGEARFRPCGGAVSRRDDFGERESDLRRRRPGGSNRTLGARGRHRAWAETAPMGRQGPLPCPLARRWCTTLRSGGSGGPPGGVRRAFERRACRERSCG